MSSRLVSASSSLASTVFGCSSLLLLFIAKSFATDDERAEFDRCSFPDFLLIMMLAAIWIAWLIKGFLTFITLFLAYCHRHSEIAEKVCYNNSLFITKFLIFFTGIIMFI